MNPAVGEQRRLVLLVSVAILLDTLFFSVITPLLPALAHQLKMSKLAAGVLTGGYPAGMLIASLPGGALAVRRGPRFTLVAGLALMVISTIGFAFLQTAAALDAARFLEGVGGACSWAGGIAWIVAATPAPRRGAVMGQALGTAIAGSLFGPAVGALASLTGRGVLFTALALLALALVVPILALEQPGESSAQPVSAALGILRRPAVAAVIWLMLLPAIVSGLINVLAPLRLHALGAGAGAIGATFLVGAALESLVSPLAGRVSDRHGRVLPLRAGCLAVGLALAAFTLPSEAAVLAALVALVSMLLGVFWAPVMALLSDLAETHALDQAHAAALMNLAWAAGQIAGAVGSGAVAGSLGDAAPTLALAVLCLLTLLVTRGRALRRPQPA
ncbi:MAG TPA: MFS transporter [Solirubrobacteraceae bacterium]|nr:MFS transporter [Solirubrobacteraceae bacterium]